MKKTFLLALVAIFTLTPLMSFGSDFGSFHKITNKTYFAKKYKGVKSISVKQVVLNVRITRSSDDMVFAKAYVGSMETNVEDYRISERLVGSTLEIYQEPTKGNSSFRKSEGFIEITLPEELKDIVVISTSGDISLKDIAASQIELRSVSGDVQVSNCSADVLSFKTTSGDVYIDNANANQLSSSSVSGDVKITRSKIKQSINCSSVSGDCSVSDSQTETIKASSVSGDCSIQKNHCSVLSAKTTSGDITAMILGTPKQLQFTSVSGDANIFVKGSLREYGYSLKSMSGDLKAQGVFTARKSIELPSANGSVIEAITTSGDILIRNF